MTRIVAFDARAAMERQAREWLVRLDGDEPLTSEETRALHEWLDRSPSHREELTRLSRFWASANVLTQLAVPLQRERVAGFRSARGGVAMAACAVIASLILVVWWAQRPREEATNGVYATAIGEQERIELGDGSSIQLNTDSRVRVEYSETLRRIRLLQGEALFSVAHNADRPFDVYAGQGRVRAVGTAFAVQLGHERGVVVTVTQGAVEVAEFASPGAVSAPVEAQVATSPHRLARLRAGETIRIDGGARDPVVEHLAGPELQRRMAWHEGYLVFNGEALSEVVAQVNRYSSVTLQIDDPRLAAIAIGGRFRIGDLDAVLDVLHESFGIQAHRIDDRRIRLEPVPQP